MCGQLYNLYAYLMQEHHHAENIARLSVPVKVHSVQAECAISKHPHNQQSEGVFITHLKYAVSITTIVLVYKSRR